MRIFFTKTISVERLTKNSIYTDRETYVSTGRTFKGFLMPLGAEDAFLTDGNLAKAHKLYSEKNADIIETDRVTIDSQAYIVKGVQVYDFGTLSRREYIIEEMNS